MDDFKEIYLLLGPRSCESSTFIRCTPILIWSFSKESVIYRIVASTSPSRIEAHAGLFRLLMKGIFDPYVLWPFDKKLIFKLVTRVRTRDYTVFIGCKMLDLVGPKWKFSVAKQLWFNRRPTNSVASLFHFSCHNIIIQVKASQFWHCALALFVIHEKIVSSNFRQRSNIWFYKNT